MGALSPALLAALRAQAAANKEAIQSGSFTPSWYLGGSKSIVPPGGSVVIRLAPRWDIGDSKMADPANPSGPKIANPEYDFDAFPYVVAIDHLWQDDEGKWHHEWCPKT